MTLIHSMIKTNVDDSAHQAATSHANARPQPTTAQAKAGNCKKGKIRINGLDISIENPAGSTRNPAWPPMSAHYGDIKRTTGNDGDNLDVFVKPGTRNDWDGTVFVIDQKDEDSDGFDEHKVMLGWDTESMARRAYLSHYPRNWEKNVIGIKAMSVDELKEWMTGDLTKPASVGKSLLIGMLYKAKSTQIHQSPASLNDKARALLVKQLDKFFEAQKKLIIPQVTKAYGEPFDGVAKSALLHAALFKSDTPDPDKLVEQVELDGWDAMIDVVVTPAIEAAFIAAGLWAIKQLVNKGTTPEAIAAIAEAVNAEPTTAATINVMTNMVNDAAVAYAKEQAAQLVTQISDSTRAMIRQTVAQALTEGKGSFELATMLEESRAFDAVRSDLIASYELGQAAVSGNMAAWKASGVVKKKQWITADDEIVSDECTANAEQGPIPMDDNFQSGHMHPLAHPHCRCDCVAII